MLVLAPHPDDESFMGGLLYLRAQQGWEIHVGLATLGQKQGDRTQRQNEFVAALGAFGAKAFYFKYAEQRENTLDQVSMASLVEWIDEVIACGYDEVYGPYPSHHADHRMLYEAMCSSLRKVESPAYPKFVALYEYPYVALGTEGIPGGRCYVDITGEALGHKLAALSCYKSQLRPYPSLSSLEAVTRLAKMRGMECGKDAAELFYIQRMVSE